MRLSAKGKSVAIEMSFWMTEDGAIHLVSNDRDAPTFHVAVRDKKSKPSGHPYLYRELAKCLRKMGAPAPAYTAESS